MAHVEILLADALGTLETAAARLVDLVRAVDRPDVLAVGEWSVADVAAHLVHAFDVEQRALSGQPLPEVTVDRGGMQTFNAAALAGYRGRDMASAAERIEALADEVHRSAVLAARRDTVRWLGGTDLSPTTVVCHLIEECLIHGHDIAAATRQRWTIPRHDAIVALEGGVFPLMSALGPGAFVDQDAARGVRLEVELRIRGGSHTFMAIADGELRLADAPSGPIDAHLSADPACLMLTFLGRRSIVRGIAEGRLMAWGRRPWRLPKLLAVTNPP